MSTFHLVVALCLGAHLLDNGSPKECMTTVEGYTWKYDDSIDELVVGVDTVDLCYKTCADDTRCQGYTWTNAGVVQLCYKFKHRLLGYHECVACSSGVLPQSVDGRINCIFTPPDQCVEYLVLDQADRSVNNGGCG